MNKLISVLGTSFSQMYSMLNMQELCVPVDGHAYNIGIHTENCISYWGKYFASSEKV